MGVILSCRNLTKAFGSQALFSGLSFGLDENERAGLIGRNGAGKSTLLRILSGLEEMDEGEITSRRGLRVGYVPQEEDFPPGMTVTEVLEDALAADRLDQETRDARIATTLGKAGFTNPDAPAEILSGGWRKRLSIAREMVQEPGLLLFDEPTNHLDIEGIMWLEKILAGARFAWLAVSHDRYLLENVANRVIELGPQFPDGYFSATGCYTDFLMRREEALTAQRKREQTLRVQARREIEWLRRGPKARTTKARYRVRDADRIFGELAETSGRNQQDARANITFSSSFRKTAKLVEFTGVTKGFSGPPLFAGLDLLLSPGEKLGILGRNGSGKSTLLNILAGDLEPDSGTVRRAENLRVARFEQDRSSLDHTVFLRRALAPVTDHVNYRGHAVHVQAWASRFLFKPEQLDMPVANLSGGERARILIARAMAQAADLLILDEPTNDLDIPTLEVLEDSLAGFPGAVVLVTHDRYLLDRVSTKIIGLDGKGSVWGFADFEEWEERIKQEEKDRVGTGGGKVKEKEKANRSADTRPRKMTYKEKCEWQGMEAAILAAEEKMEGLAKAVESPEVCADPVRLRDSCAKLGGAQAEVNRLYERWAELEELRS